MHRLLTLLLILSLVGCSPLVNTEIIKSYSPIDYKEEVHIIDTFLRTPPNAVKLGTVVIGDADFTTNCGWDLIIKQAKLETRKAGGNTVKTIKHIPPNFWSSCHRITAHILKIDNLEEYKKKELKAIEKLKRKESYIDNNSQYTLLHVYRPSKFLGSALGYDLHLGNSVICRVKNNHKQTVKIKKLA